MSHSKVALTIGVALVATATACADEDPTGLGPDLLPGDVNTFELLLDPSTFLVNDTTVGGFTDASDAGFILVAREFGGDLNANALLRFGALPTSVTYEDEEGVSRTDNDPTFIGGSLVLHLDSMAMSAPGAATVRLSTLGQNWNPGDATWNVRRVNDDDVEQSWSEPGGTPGDLSFDGEWDASADSVVIPVDSQAVATIFDEDSGARGVLIRLMTDNSRFRLSNVQGNAVFHLEAIPSEGPGDVVTTEVEPSGGRAIFDAPEPDLAEGELRAGGLRGWRTVLQFNPRLDTLTVPVQCPGGQDGCEISLSESTISMAALVLEPLPVPRAFEPEDTLALEPHLLLVSENVPPNRAPVGNQVASPHLLEPGAFSAGGSLEDVSIPLTSFIANLTGERSDDRGSPPSDLALISVPASSSVGYAAFGGARMPEGGGVVGPRLRILVTTVDLGGIR